MEMEMEMEVEMETEMGGHHGGGDNDRNLILIFDMERGKILLLLPVKIQMKI